MFSSSFVLCAAARKQFLMKNSRGIIQMSEGRRSGVPSYPSAGLLILRE